MSTSIKKPKTRPSDSNVKNARRLTALYVLLTGSLPRHKPSCMSEDDYRRLVSLSFEGSIVDLVEIKNCVGFPTRVAIAFPESYDIYIHSACSFIGARKRRSLTTTSTRTARFRWWSDTMIGYISPVTSVRSGLLMKSVPMVVREFGIPEFLALHPRIQELYSDRKLYPRLLEVFGDIFFEAVHIYDKNPYTIEHAVEEACRFTLERMDGMDDFVRDMIAL